MSSCPDPANNSAGFTLVELMVTVVVLSIVMLVAVPSFNSLVQGNRLTGQVNQ
ncbi:Tfp pilus assembly protein FimT/FimU, partial [Rheinheimera aquimaris]